MRQGITQFQTGFEPSAVENILWTKELFIQRSKTLEQIRIRSQNYESRKIDSVFLLLFFYVSCDIKYRFLYISILFV